MMIYALFFALFTFVTASVHCFAAPGIGAIPCRIENEKLRCDDDKQNPREWQFAISFEQLPDDEGNHHPYRYSAGPLKDAEIQNSGAILLEPESAADANKGVFKLKRVHIVFDLKHPNGKIELFHKHAVDIHELKNWYLLQEKDGYEVIQIRAKQEAESKFNVRLKLLTKGRKPKLLSSNNSDKVAFEIEIENGRIIPKYKNQPFKHIAFDPSLGDYRFWGLGKLVDGIRSVMICEETCEKSVIEKISF